MITENELNSIRSNKNIEIVKVEKLVKDLTIEELNWIVELTPSYACHEYYEGEGRIYKIDSQDKDFYLDDYIDITEMIESRTEK